MGPVSVLPPARRTPAREPARARLVATSLAAALATALSTASVVGVTSSDASAGGTGSVAVRVVPPQVTAGDPARVVAEVGTAGREVEVQQRVDDGWAPVGTVTADKAGLAQLPLDTGSLGDGLAERSVGTTTYRVVAAEAGKTPEQTSRAVDLEVNPETNCRPDTAPVDPEATGEAICLAARIDNWRRAGLMGIGQQVNASSQQWAAPLDELDDPVAVVGFDLEELDKSFGYEHPFGQQVLDDLLGRADAGAVLVASWHARNPHTGGPFTDTSWSRVDRLLKDTPQAAAFWEDFDAKMALLARFQTGDDGRFGRTAVVFRPLHEANGDFFWWGKPKPKHFKRLWARMQSRAADLGVHNVLWAYSFNLHTAGVDAPARLVPRRLDLAGLDSYDPEEPPRKATRKQAKRVRKDKVLLDGYAEVARMKQVPRMAITEVGPHGSDGSWNPKVITRVVDRELSRRAVRPAWAMLWFDDTGYPGAGAKQIGSLRGGERWLAGSPGGFHEID